MIPDRFIFCSLAGSLTSTADNEAFLFSLVNPSGNEPLKITQKPGASGGIRCKCDMGPSFGDKTYYDLQVWNGKERAGRLDLGYSFSCPERAGKTTYFTGKSPFNITELEVFQIDVS